MYKAIGGDGKPYGPVSAEQLKQWYLEGRVNGQTQICAEGAAEWKPLSDVPELQALLRTPPVLGAPSAGPGFQAPAPFTPATGKPPPSYMVWAILCTLCCCPIPGPVAIFYAFQVNSKVAQGDYDGARKASASARMWCWIAFVVGILATIYEFASLGSIMKLLQQGGIGLQ
jgi:hypothetical protein